MVADGQYDIRVLNGTNSIYAAFVATVQHGHVTFWRTTSADGELKYTTHPSTLAEHGDLFLAKIDRCLTEAHQQEPPRVTVTYAPLEGMPPALVHFDGSYWQGGAA